MKKPYEIIKLDKYTGEIEPPSLLLKNRSFQTIGKISRYENWNISLVGNGIDEISFDVHKYTDGILCPVWDDLIDLKIVDVSGFGRFEISVNYTDNTDTVKSIHGFSLETELAQISLYEFHVNDEEAADMEITEYSKDNYKDGNFLPTTFYNPKDEKHSLLHRVLADKAPHWSIGYVTPYIALDEESQPQLSSEFQRTYTVDGETIYDFLTGTVAEESNVVFVFDTAARQINCYSLCDCIDQTTREIKTYKGEKVTGIGEDTMVLVSKNKLANEFTISSNKDNVKNCFRIEGGDDVITDMVRAVNMNGSNYIYQFADFQYHDMSEELRKKIKDYQNMMSSEKTQNEYYGNGDMDRFLNGSFALKVNSKLDAAFILTVCENNKIKTNNLSIHNYQPLNYWYIEKASDGKKELCAFKIRYPYKNVSAAINSMGIYARLCSAYDILGYFESSMMPNTDMVTEPGKAEEQYDKLFQELNKSTVAVSSMNNYDSTLFVGVTNNIEAYAQVFLDSRFDLEIIKDTVSYSYTKGAKTGTWKGKIRITQHTDETNVSPVDISAAAELEITVNGDELEFAKQKVYKALSKASMSDIDFEVAQMDETGIRNYFSQYSLNRLTAFSDGYNTCLSVLMELGETTTSEVQNEMYNKYEQRYKIIESIKEERQSQVDEINEKIIKIQKEQSRFQKDHDFQSYLGEHCLEFCRYRREDTYTNSNYISDGLTTSECLAKAKELVEAATKEAKKACVLQRTVSTSMNNLFALPEFEPLYDKFALYNYIRIRTEDEILKLRLIGIEFSGDSPEDINVTFSEQIESIDGTLSDLQSIIQQAKSMATGYPSTVLQAEQGAEAKSSVLDMYNHGLNAAKTMLKNNDSNEVTITSSGILCKRMDDEGSYGEKQLRITGNIMAFTDDNWQSVRMAIGETMFQNPVTGDTKPEYGIIADNLVGKLIAGDKAFIGNKENNVLITGDGITIKNGTITWGKDGNGNGVNAPAMSDINGLSEFKNKVNAALTGSATTEIGSDYVISPKIGGGYLYIKDKRTSSDKTGISVEINPNGTNFTGHNGEYVFNISKNNGKDLIMGVNTSGNGYFKGRIEASGGKIANFNISQNELYTDGYNSNFDENKGIYFGQDGLMIKDKFKIDGNGNLTANSGNIGGWDITGSSIIKIDKDGSFMQLDSNNKSLISQDKETGMNTKFHNSRIMFNNNDTSYLDMYVTKWKGRTENGLNFYSNKDNKYVCFGHDKDTTDIGYSPTLVLNYGLNPGGYTQNVLIYGDTLIEKGLSVGGVNYGKKLNVDGGGHISGSFEIGNNLDVGNHLDVWGNLYVSGAIESAFTSAPNLHIGNERGKIAKTSGSSKRFKTEIKPVGINDLNPDKLYDIDIVQYKFKTDYLSEEDQRYDKEVIGFIAEDIYEKYPIAADYTINDDGNTIVNDWNFRYMIPAMLKLIQDQKKEMDIMKQEIENLKLNK